MSGRKRPIRAFGSGIGSRWRSQSRTNARSSPLAHRASAGRWESTAACSSAVPRRPLPRMASSSRRSSSRSNGPGEDEAERVPAQLCAGGEQGLGQRDDGKAAVEAAGEQLPRRHLDAVARADPAGEATWMLRGRRSSSRIHQSPVRDASAAPGPARRSATASSPSVLRSGRPQANTPGRRRCSRPSRSHVRIWDGLTPAAASWRRVTTPNCRAASPPAT
jgi:hypothetical protein